MNRLTRLISTALLLAVSLLHTQQAHAQGDAPRYDVHVDDAPARAFFEGLVADSSVNMMVHPDVKGRVTLSLKQVTLVEALEAARDLYGYDFRTMGHGYVIMPATMQTRVFQLNYLDLQRIGVSRTRVSSGQVTQNANSTSGGDTGSQDEQTQTSSTTGTAVLTRNESDFWKEIEANITSLVGAPSKEDKELNTSKSGNVVINRQSGVIVVRAMPEDLRSVGEYLRKTQSTITRQVILEAKVIEVADQLFASEPPGYVRMPDRRIDLLRWFGEYKPASDDELIERLTPYVGDFDENSRFAAIDGLSGRDPAKIAPPLIAALIRPEEESGRIKRQIVEVLAASKAPLGDTAAAVTALLSSGPLGDDFKVDGAIVKKR